MKLVWLFAISILGLSIFGCGGRLDEKEKSTPPVIPVKPPVVATPTPTPTNTPIGGNKGALRGVIGSGQGLETRETEHYEISTLIGQVAPVQELVSESATYGMKSIVVEESK